MKFINGLAWLLVVIGALNWGLVGIFHFNLVTMIFGDMSIISRVVFILVGLAGIWKIIIACTGGCSKTAS